MLDIIMNRRSTRKYQDKPIDDSILESIINCGRNAPFGGKPTPKCQVTEYIIIKDQNIKEKLALDYDDRQFIKDAPVIIAILANKDNDPKYEEYVLSAGLSLENMVIGAEALGLGCCILSCFMNYDKHREDKEKLRSILNLSDKIELIALLTLGYKDKEEIIPAKELRQYSDVVHIDKYI